MKRASIRQRPRSVKSLSLRLHEATGSGAAFARARLRLRTRRFPTFDLEESGEEQSGPNAGTSRNQRRHGALVMPAVGDSDAMSLKRHVIVAAWLLSGLWLCAHPSQSEPGEHA